MHVILKDWTTQPSGAIAELLVQGDCGCRETWRMRPLTSTAFAAIAGGTLPTDFDMEVIDGSIDARCDAHGNAVAPKALRFDPPPRTT